jgi:flagellar biosynthesis protein FlhG
MLDQAAGLRRLLGCAPLRAIAIAGSGATTLTVNLASALGASGMDVLVVDENANHGNVSDQLGISTRYELIHALNGERLLRDIICEAATGVCVLPAARGARELALAADGRGFSDCLRKAGPVPDLLLIDSAGGGVSQLLRGTANCEIVIVAGARHDSITAAYSLIKNAACEFGDSRFRIIVNRARDAAAAEAIFQNMAAVAHKHVGARLDYLGWMPNDPQCRLARSAQKSVAGAFPASAAAAAVRGLAQRLRDGSAEVRETTDIFHRGMHAAGAGSPIGNQPLRNAAAVFS